MMKNFERKNKNNCTHTSLARRHSHLTNPNEYLQLIENRIRLNSLNLMRVIMQFDPNKKCLFCYGPKFVIYKRRDYWFKRAIEFSFDQQLIYLFDVNQILYRAELVLLKI